MRRVLLALAVVAMLGVSLPSMAKADPWHGGYRGYHSHHHHHHYQPRYPQYRSYYGSPYSSFRYYSGYPRYGGCATPYGYNRSGISLHFGF